LVAIGFRFLSLAVRQDTLALGLAGLSTLIKNSAAC